MKFSLAKTFWIGEIEESRVLQICALFLFFTYIITFDGWIGNTGITSHTCSSHAAYCDVFKAIFWYNALPFWYTQNIFYVLLLSVIVIGMYSLYIKDFFLTWISLCIVFVWKCLYIYFFWGGNFDYYDIVLSAIFLFSSNKLYFLRITYVFLYFLASTIKIHEWWILGTYFTALQTWIPLFPDVTAPIWTNLVIVSQIVLCWWLFFKKKTYLFIIAEVFFLAFHFYSWILVEYRYLLSTIPFVVILFVMPEKVRYKKSYNIAFYAIASLLLLGQSVAISIAWDQKMTLEGNKYGLYMFEANHQCIATYTFYSGEGQKKWEIIHSSQIARDRCDPYTALMRYKGSCAKDTRIWWQFDHSINGWPFYRIVDEENLCVLSYSSFSRNAWIRSELSEQEIIGYPVKSFYDGQFPMLTQEPFRENEIIRLPWYENNDPIEQSWIQKKLRPYMPFLEGFYWILWVGMFATICILHFRKMHIYNKNSKEHDIML